MMNLNPNPKPPWSFCMMEEPSMKILIKFDGGRQKSPGVGGFLERGSVR
jgi:hypothetical protein